MSLPSNPHVLMEPYPPRDKWDPGRFKFVGCENGNNGRTDHDFEHYRGLKNGYHPEMRGTSSKFPPRVERNPGGGLWMQGRQRVHWSCNRAKPNRPGWAPDITLAGKDKPRDPWTPPRASA